jgi:DNA polymerase-3 subunit delta
MIIFLYGPDTYRSLQKLKEIVDHYKKVHQEGLNLKFFEGEKFNYQKFKEEIEQRSIFKEKKFLILKDVFLNQEFKDKFLRDSKKYLNSDNLILFFERGEIKAEDSFFKFLKKFAKCQNFQFLEDQKLKNWIKREFQNYKTEIEDSALEKLINFVGRNSWQLSNEIKKLVSYKKRKKIEKRDVEILIKPKIETDIFQTIDILASKNKKRAIELIHQHLKKGDSPLYLLAMINFQFRNLLLLKSYPFSQRKINEISQKLALSPFLAKKLFFKAQKFSLEELKKIYQKIFQIDLEIKTGKLEPKMALDLLIIQI